MNAVYTALSRANGYLVIEYDKKVKLLIYATPKNITQIDFSEINIADYNNFEIELVVVDDYKLHKNTEGKEGYHTEWINVKHLGNFNKYK